MITASGRFVTRSLSEENNTQIRSRLPALLINDLPNISNLVDFILYADDANIIIAGYSEEEIQCKVDQLSSLLMKWVDSNGLALNLKKTHRSLSCNPEELQETLATRRT